MTSFVQKSFEKLKTTEEQVITEYNSICRYSEFLKQPLMLAMFVPCDEKGNVLAEPKMKVVKIGFDEEDVSWDIDEVEIYRNAKEKVLFKGFYVEFNAVKSPQGGHLDVGNLQNKTIETIIGAELELTESAIKQIGLNP